VVAAVAFCKASGYSSEFLWTISGILVAENLYRSVGFERTQEIEHEMWGIVVTEVRYDLVLDKRIEPVNPSNTFQVCSGCDQVVLKDLYERVHRCPFCG
jgi:hypothetical protein